MAGGLVCYVINSIFCRMYKKEFKAYTRINDVRALQKEKLLKILRANKTCAYGEKYGFVKINSMEEFQNSVPLTDYEDYREYLERIKKGEKGVLTTDEILLLELSSGSASPSKLIPYTQALKEEFQRGIRPWLYDLYTSFPGLKWGKSYWSVTPASSRNQVTQGGIPIGFEDDKEYFGPLEKLLFNYIFAVSSDVAKAGTIEEFYHKTALGLLKSRDLTLVSVWNPSLLMLLLEYMEKHAEKLAEEITLENKNRGAEIKKLLRNKRFELLWPNLKVISCWADASAKPYGDKLKEIFPGVIIQPKGLLATEGFISFPLVAARGAVLSVKSHFFEFQEVSNHQIVLADQLEKEKEYGVILTTSGGLYRYRLKDIIKVTGFMGPLPVIKFIGKQDKVSDLFGEKLNEQFVKASLEKSGINEEFYMLAPEVDRYVLYTSQDMSWEAVDQALRENFHYDYCRKLGQLKELKIFKLTGNPGQEYLEECAKRGQRLGDIKPVALHLQGGWDKVFKGEYV